MYYLKPIIARSQPVAFRSAFASLDSQFDRLFAELAKDFAASESQSTGAASRQPRFRWYGSKERYAVHVDLPGVASDAVAIEFKDGQIELSASRKDPLAGEEQKESGEERFELRFAVPKDVAADKISSTLQDGVLAITLPKAEAARPRRIAIN